MKLPTLAMAALLALAPLAARAGDDTPEADTESALAKTQASLRDPAQRDAAVKGSKAAADADAKVHAVAKSDADVQAIYDLSAELMKTLTAESGGDPEKMQKMMLEAQANPEKFAEKLTPEQREKLAKLAKQFESNQASPAKPAATSADSAKP